jgi:hypothetical protein
MSNTENYQTGTRDFQVGDVYVHPVSEVGVSLYGFLNHIWERNQYGRWISKNDDRDNVSDGDIEWVLNNNDEAIWISQGVVRQPCPNA